MFSVKVETRIMLVCPCCKLGSRWDTSFLEDAIRENKVISCAMCGGHFEITLRAVEHTAIWTCRNCQAVNDDDRKVCGTCSTRK